MGAATDSALDQTMVDLFARLDAEERRFEDAIARANENVEDMNTGDVQEFAREVGFLTSEIESHYFGLVGLSDEQYETHPAVVAICVRSAELRGEKREADALRDAGSLAGWSTSR